MIAMSMVAEGCTIEKIEEFYDEPEHIFEGASYRGIKSYGYKKPDPNKYAKHKAFMRKAVEDRDKNEIGKKGSKTKAPTRPRSSDIIGKNWAGAMYKAYLQRIEESEAERKGVSKTPISNRESEGESKSINSDKTVAKAIIDFVNAITGAKKLTKGKYQEAYNIAKTQLDFKKGGLLNKSKNGEETPYEIFKDFPDVLKAAKAHKAYLKAKDKEEIS